MLINHWHPLGWSSKYHKPGGILAKSWMNGFLYSLRFQRISDSAKRGMRKCFCRKKITRLNGSMSWSDMAGLSFWFSFFVGNHLLNNIFLYHTVSDFVHLTPQKIEKMILHMIQVHPTYLSTGRENHCTSKEAKSNDTRLPTIMGGKPTTSRKTALAKLYNFHQLEKLPKTSKTVA